MAKKQNKENETETVKSTEMDSFLSVIQAAFGKKSDIFVKDPSNIDLERFSTGSYLLDRDLKGGWVKGTMIEIYGNESSGKAQPLSAKILTPDGWINMGDAQEGTVVCTPDGDTSPVTGIFPQGVKDVYEITLTSGQKAESTLDHLWSVQLFGRKKVVTLDEIIHSNSVAKFPVYSELQGVEYIEAECIRKVRQEECQCIMIGHPDHLYITNDYIVTHNTTLAIHSAAEHQKAYPDEKVLWIDLEKVFDPVYFQTIGLNIEPENFLLARPNTGEEAWQIMIEFTKAFQNGLIVLDSVALLLPEKEEEMLMTENSFAQAARMNSLGLRKLFPHVRMGGTTIIALNQVREDIGCVSPDTSVKYKKL